MPKFLIVTMLPYSRDVANIYVVEAANENEAHKAKVKHGFISIIKNLDEESLPLKVFRTIDEPEE